MAILRTCGSGRGMMGVFSDLAGGAVGRGLPARTRYRMTTTSTKMTPRMTKTIIKMGGPATAAVSGCGVCSGVLVGGGAVGGGFVVMASAFCDVVAGRVLGRVMVLVGELTSI